MLTSRSAKRRGIDDGDNVTQGKGLTVAATTRVRGGGEEGGDRDDPNNIVYWILVSKREMFIQQSEPLILILC
jgi:hypothetical protein